MISHWNFGKGFPFNYLPLLFPHRACRKKCSGELELEFLETEETTRHGGPQEPQTIWDFSLTDYVSRESEILAVRSKSLHEGQQHISHMTGDLTPAPLLFHLLTLNLPLHHNLNFLWRRGKGVAVASTGDVDREVTTVSLFHVFFL